MHELDEASVETISEENRPGPRRRPGIHDTEMGRRSSSGGPQPLKAFKTIKNMNQNKSSKNIDFSHQIEFSSHTELSHDSSDDDSYDVSEESKHFSDSSNLNNSTNSSSSHNSSSNRTISFTKTKTVNSYITQSTNYQPNTSSNKIHKRPLKTKSPWSCGGIMIFLTLPMLIACGAFSFHNDISNWVANQLTSDYRQVVWMKFDAAELRSDIKKLQSDFPAQNEAMWQDFQSSINDTITGHGPTFVLLLAVEEKTAVCLAKKLSKVAQKTLEGKGELIITAQTAGTQISDVIVLERDILQTRSIIIFDVLNLNPEILKGFHWLFDSEHPMVKEAVYVMTMKSDHFNVSQNSLDFAEQQITDTYRSVIHTDQLNALITRITADMVIPVWPERSIPCNNPRY